MELFDRKFVYVLWEDSLEGKECFVADEIGDLLENVDENKNRTFLKMAKSCAGEYPFAEDEESDEVMCWRFAYYDPNYEIKRAYYKEGKTIQYQLADELNWRDVEDEDAFERLLEEGRVFRIKPEEKWIVYLARPKNDNCYLIACREDMWEFAQKEGRTKSKLFIGTRTEALKWICTRKEFTEVIKAWEDGIDSKVCASCPQDEERKRERIEERASKFGEVCVHPEYNDEKCKECNECIEGSDYRPYKSSAEMIADFTNRFLPVKECPSYCEPLIWLKSKDDLEKALITNYYGETKVSLADAYWTMEELFNQWTYLDESPVGMEVKE